MLKPRIGFLLFCFFAVSTDLAAQSDSTKPEVIVGIHHITVNNSLQYLIVETKMKVDKKWEMIKDQALEVYLDSNKTENLIGKAQTNSKGKAKLVIPATLKPLWDASPVHKYIVVTQATPKLDQTIAEAEITRAKILMDTSNNDGVRTVNVEVLKFEGDQWLPAKDVELKIGVRRLGGALRIGEEETYTTDSLGQVAAEFKIDTLPADQKGNLILIASVEDNDNYGSLSIEKTVPWGVYVKHVNDFGKRSLYATSFKTPLWLLFMAYFIIASVWGTIIYLLIQIIRLRKEGKNQQEEESTQSIKDAVKYSIPVKDSPVS